MPTPEPLAFFERRDILRHIAGLSANDVQTLASRPPDDPAIVPRIRPAAGPGARSVFDFYNMVEFAIASTLLQLGLQIPAIARHLHALRGRNGLERVQTDPTHANVIIIPATGEAAVLTFAEFKQLLDAGEAPALVALSLSDLVRDLRHAIETGSGRVVVQAARMNLKPEHRKR